MMCPHFRPLTGPHPYRSFSLLQGELTHSCFCFPLTHSFFGSDSPFTKQTSNLELYFHFWVLSVGRSFWRVGYYLTKYGFQPILLHRLRRDYKFNGYSNQNCWITILSSAPGTMFGAFWVLKGHFVEWNNERMNRLISKKEKNLRWKAWISTFKCTQQTNIKTN